MPLIISDASPIHYLALIGETQILPALYAKVIIPQKVYDEIRQPQTPAIVRSFANALPAWVEVRAISSPIDESLLTLDREEQEAITLALEMKADALLIDESKGRDAARLHGLRIIGTMRVLYDAAGVGLCDLEKAFEKLRQTNFRASAALYKHFLELHSKRSVAF